MISDLGTLMIKGQAIRRLSTVHCLFSFALPYPSRSCILRCRHSLALPIQLYKGAFILPVPVMHTSVMT